MKSKTTFTKKDVIVFLACIVFLLANLGLVSTNGREHAKQMVCATNIRQLLAALTIHANNNDGNFPENHGGYWLWDIDRNTADYIIEGGATTETFYCPSNRQQKVYREWYWYYPGNCRANQGSYAVTSYFWLLYNENMAGWTYYEDREQQIVMPFEKKMAKRIDVNAPAEFELIIDATLSDPVHYDSTEYPDGNFERILIGSSIPYDSSNHIKRPQEGLGGNIGFVDGHVEWRDFSDMIVHLDQFPWHWW